MRNRSMIATAGMIAASILTPTFGSTQTPPACPNPVPKQPTLSEIAACMLEFQRNAIPKGTVVAMTTPCPKEGWSSYEEAYARVIIGAIPGDIGDKVALPDIGLKEKYKFGETGGEEQVTLSLAQMPAHTHKVRAATFANSSATNFAATGKYGIDQRTITTDEKDDGSKGSIGSSEPHNNMPPYIALYFCKKK